VTDSFLAKLRLLRPEQQPGTRVPTDPFDPIRHHASRGYAQAALDDEIGRVLSAVNGTRNHTLNQAAFSLGQLVAGGELAEGEVVDGLTAAARQIGLTDNEIMATIASGLRAGGTTPRNVPPRVIDETGVILALTAPTGELPIVHPAADRAGDAEQAAEEVDVAAQVREYFPRLDWAALWADESEEEWIVEPILPARRLVALYSPPKVGKSLLMLEIAVGVARGSSILGVVPDRPRRVLYVDFENDPKGDIRERLTAMGYGPGDLDNLVYLSFPRLAALDSAQGGAQLMASVEAYECEVVVIDTVSRAIQGEENENDTWLAFYRHTGRALKSAGVSLIRLDHTGKDETKGQRGGSAKSGDVDAVWRMSKVNDTVFQLVCEANRMPVMEKTLVLHRETRPHLHHRVDGAGRMAAWDAKVSDAMAALDHAAVSPAAGRAKAREALSKVGVKVRNDVLEEALRQRKLSTGFDPGPAPKIMGQVSGSDLPPRSWGNSGQETFDAA
jgi:hypothetical protein